MTNNVVVYWPVVGGSSGYPSPAGVGPQSLRQKDDEIEYLRSQLQVTTVPTHMVSTY